MTRQPEQPATHGNPGCCAWDNKRAFDSVRPITAIRMLLGGRPVRAWAGPYHGTKLIDGAAWIPYQPTTFPTPPFPEYSSGHSNFSAAGAEILRLFAHNDRFGASITLPAGSSRVEPAAVPASDLTLSWATFSEAANQAGVSRRYRGHSLRAGRPGRARHRPDRRPGRLGESPGLLARELTASRDDELAVAEALNGNADPSMRK